MFGTGATDHIHRATEGIDLFDETVSTTVDAAAKLRSAQRLIALDAAPLQDTTSPAAAYMASCSAGVVATRNKSVSFDTRALMTATNKYALTCRANVFVTML